MNLSALFNLQNVSTAFVAATLLLTLPACEKGEDNDTSGSADSGEGEEDSADTDSKDEDSADEDSDTEDEDSADSGGTDPGCEEINCDPGAPIDAGECGEGQKCSPWRCGDGCCTNSTKCTDIEGDAGAGDSCNRDEAEQTDDCDATLFCMPDMGSTGTGGPGKCEQLCSPEPGKSGNCDELGLSGFHCFNFNQGSFPACLPTCDPLTRDCEDEGKECYLAIDNFFCTLPTDPNGEAGDPGKPGEECATEQGCQGGTVCAPADLSKECTNTNCGAVDTCGCCATVCDLSADDPDEPCGDDEKCEKAIANPAAAVKHVGVCVIPNG